MKILSVLILLLGSRSYAADLTDAPPACGALPVPCELALVRGNVESGGLIKGSVVMWSYGQNGVTSTTVYQATELVQDSDDRDVYCEYHLENPKCQTAIAIVQAKSAARFKELQKIGVCR